jgi:hypothetical protein
MYTSTWRLNWKNEKAIQYVCNRDNINKEEALLLFKKHLCWHSLDAYIFYFWEEEWNIRYLKNISKMTWKHFSNIDYIMKSKWVSLEEAQIIKDDYLAKTRQDKNSFIKRYWEEEWIKKYNTFVDKSKHTLNKYIKEYWEEEWKIKWEQYRKNHSDWISRERFILRFWEEEWLEKYLEYCKIRTKKFKKDYYILEYWEEEWEMKWKECCSKKIVNLELYIKKYNKDWVEKYKKLVEAKTKKFKNWYYIDTYWEELWLEMYNKEMTWPIFSKISIKFFNLLIDELDIKWALFWKNEKLIADKNSKKIFRVDFLYWNKIIEFYWDYWHHNPSIFSWDKITYWWLIGETIWENDRIREKMITDNWFQLLIIREKDFNTKLLWCIEKAKKFLLNN